MTKKTNIVFQIKDLKDLQLSLKTLYKNNKSDDNISNLNYAYYISCDEPSKVIKFIKENKSDINESFYEYVILRTFDNGISPASETRVFKFNYSTKQYEPELLDNVQMDFPFDPIIEYDEYVLKKY